jgi:pimeloyl-ACP methyl ester carboxylesterase
LKPETVVLVPGLWLPAASLTYLARGLARCGFETRCFSYPSVRGGLRANAERLNAFLARVDAPVVHLVGHSLGGVVIRALFQYFPAQRPGRIVMLASPLQGSRAAARVLRTRRGARLVGESVAELQGGSPARWPLPAREIGVVRGTLPVGLGRLVCRLRGPNDGLLELTETALPGATDSVDLPVAHTAMLVSRRAVTQVCHFLRHGRFARPAPALPRR